MMLLGYQALCNLRDVILSAAKDPMHCGSSYGSQQSQIHRSFVAFGRSGCID